MIKRITAFIAVIAVAQIAAAQRNIVATRTLPACKSQGQVVKLSLDTGTGGPIPTADPIWTITFPSTIAPFSTTKFGSAWIAPFAGTNWIQPFSSGTPVHTSVQKFIYRTTFDTPVDPFLYGSITITGQYAADDDVVLKLNNIPFAQCTKAAGCFGPPPQTIPAGTTWTQFNRFPGFHNVITAEVTNKGVVTGFMMKADIVAECSKCTAVPPPDAPCRGNTC